VPVREQSAIVLMLWLAIAGTWYFMLLSAGRSLFEPGPYELVFNNMLLHLLHGRFDVDPAAIGYEGFERGGAVYAYFGIFPALLRLPFVLLPGFATTNFNLLSCLVAACLMALFKMLSALIIWRRFGEQQSAAMLVPMRAVIFLSGAQVQFLRPSLYQESCSWAGVFAAAFVLLLLHGWSRSRGFTTAILSALAAVAGFCLLTRVSTALGLYVALALLCAVLAWRNIGASMVRPPFRLSGLVPAIVVLAVFAGAAGVLNYERWGNPFVFMPSQDHYLFAQKFFPDRITRHQEFGDFNVIRLGYGIVYYWFPFWVMRDGSGHLLWSDFVRRTIDAVELPPASFLVSDPLWVGLGGFALVRFCRDGETRRRTLPVGAAAVGLAVPVILALTYVAMSFRYRIEFYPLLELCGFLGFASAVAAPSRKASRFLLGAAVLSIIGSHLQWFLYRISVFGPVVGCRSTNWHLCSKIARDGVISYYWTLLHH
jgi:hypothetical protein